MITSIHNYFTYKADLAKGQLRKVFRDGRTFLLIGLATLFVCFMASNFVENNFDFSVKPFVREGLLISGWVAMWRPVEVYLYDRWLIREKIRLLEKISRIEIAINEVK